MSLTFYSAYRSSIAKKPVNMWRELMQESVNDTWDDTSTVTNIKGQTAVGSTIYGAESVQLNSVIDPKTGTSFGDDYRKIIYKNYFGNSIPYATENYQPLLVKTENGVEYYRFVDDEGNKVNVRVNSRFLGKYYQFEGNYWLITNTSTVIGSIATAILRRCNNRLKWYDSDGVLHSWPCIFERSLTYTNINTGSQEVPQVSSDTLIRVQLNSETATIPFNQRFIFNGHAFQVSQINNHISDTYMEIYMFETQLQSNDDIVNNIANASGQVRPTTTETRILPETNKILQGESETFSVYKYVNGVKQPDIYTITSEGPIEGTNYTLDITDNEFTVVNLLESKETLTITCTNTEDEDDVVTIDIILGGLW